MRDVATGLLAGLLFGAGLSLGGMTDPAVVLGFLDPAGAWNPALAFVMAAGLAVTFLGYRLVRRRGRPLWAPSFSLPTTTEIDRPLILGAAIFGAGWGLAGYCPGPAVASLGGGRWEVAAFVVAMLIGMIGVRFARGRGAGVLPRPVGG